MPPPHRDAHRPVPPHRGVPRRAARRRRRAAPGCAQQFRPRRPLCLTAPMPDVADAPEPTRHRLARLSPRVRARLVNGVELAPCPAPRARGALQARPARRPHFSSSNPVTTTATSGRRNPRQEGVQPRHVHPHVVPPRRGPSDRYLGVDPGAQVREAASVGTTSLPRIRDVVRHVDSLLALEPGRVNQIQLSAVVDIDGVTAVPGRGQKLPRRPGRHHRQPDDRRPVRQRRDHGAGSGQPAPDGERIGDR